MDDLHDPGGITVGRLVWKGRQTAQKGLDLARELQVKVGLRKL